MAILPLTINGKQIRHKDALRENFDLVSVLEYYKNGKLLKWLQDRLYKNEAAALEALDETTPDFAQQLCAIFGVEYSGEEINMEDIAQKQERLAKLRTYTDDAEVISNIALVAFDQEELAELLHSGTEKIYLCGDSFVVPASQKNKCYIGVNNPIVHIGGEIPENWVEQGIEFVGCTVDNLPEEVTASDDVTVQQSRIEDISGETVDRFLSLCRFGTTRHDSFLETSQFIYYDGLLHNKYTGEEKIIRSELLPFTNRQAIHTYGMILRRAPKMCFTQIGDQIVYHDADKEGLYCFDFDNLNPPKKLFSVEKIGAQFSVCESRIAYLDKVRELCLYDMSTNDGYRIPAPDKDGRAVAMCATKEGVYFYWTDDTMYLYDYYSKKVKVVFKTSDRRYGSRINRIYHVEQGNKFFVEQGDNCGVIILDEQNTSNLYARLTIEFDVMGERYEHRIHAYEDRLIYVARGGVIKSVDYKTCEIMAIADGASTHHYDSGGFWGMPRAWDSAHDFIRIGNWICFTNKEKETYRISLTPPNNFERVSNIASSLSDQELKALFSAQDMKALFPYKENADIRDLTDDMILEKLQEGIPVVTIE